MFLTDTPLTADSPMLRRAEYAASAIYGATLLYYNRLEMIENRRMRRAIADYFDPEKSQMVSWMYWATVLLVVSALATPFAMFLQNSILNALYGLFMFGAIYYFAISFICYSVSKASYLVSQAEHHAEYSEKTETPPRPAILTVSGTPFDEAVEQWTASRQYTRNSLSLQQVADEIGVSRQILSAWLKQTDYGQFAAWIAHLRIEEACRIIRSHPRYSNEAVAEACGFNSTSYYLRTFRTLKGMKPSEWAEQNVMG